MYSTFKMINKSVTDRRLIISMFLLVIMLFMNILYVQNIENQSLSNNNNSEIPSIKMNSLIQSKLTNNLELKIDLTIDQILNTQENLKIKKMSEQDFIDRLPSSTKSILSIQNANLISINNKLSGSEQNVLNEDQLDPSNLIIKMNYTGNELILENFFEFTIDTPDYKEWINIDGIYYEIIPRDFKYFSGTVQGSRNSQITISLFNNELLTVGGDGEFYEYLNNGDLQIKEFEFNFHSIPEEIQSYMTKLSYFDGEMIFVGKYKEKINVVPKESIIVENPYKGESFKINSIETHSTSVFKKAGINLYIDPYLTNDPLNFLWIEPRWSGMHNYFDNPVAGEYWMPYVNMFRQNTYYGACYSCAYSTWQSFLDDFKAGKDNSGVDASYIWSGLNIEGDSVNGIAAYAPSTGDSWGVFGYYNPKKADESYAGSENGAWRMASYVITTTGHEFAHLMGAAHEGSVSGPSGWPGHGATTACTGLYCGIGIGYFHTIMWSTTLQDNLFRQNRFSSDSSWAGTLQHTVPPYNSDSAHNNLFYVRGTVYNYARNN